VPPGTGLPAAFKPGATDQDERLAQIIQRCAALMKARHIDKFWRCFEAVEREGQMFPKMSGKVSPVHFMQHFPFLKDFSGQDIKLILQRYTEASGGVNVKAMTQDLEAADSRLDRSSSAAALDSGLMRRQSMAAVSLRSASAAALRPGTSPASLGMGTSTLTVEKAPAGQRKGRPMSAVMKKPQPITRVSPDDSQAARPSSALSTNLTNVRRSNGVKDVDTMTKVRSFLAERDIRIVDRFMDYDRLRKGVCSMNQAFSIFAVAGLLLNTKDHDFLLNEYHDGTGRFRYKDFCTDAAKSGEETHDGKPAFDKRKLRHPGSADGEELAVLTNVLDRFERQVRDRGMEIRTLFDDFRTISGICTAGHVTKAQFTRIMSMLNFKVTEAELEVLNHRFGDTCDSEEFNYLDFCNVIDPRPPPAEPQLDLDVPPFVPFKVNHYFDAAGRVIPRGALPGLGKRPPRVH